MKRLHLMEIHDQQWCPPSIRDAGTDYLQFVIIKTKPYAAMVQTLATSLQGAGTRHVLDQCSGAGGPWLWLQPILAEQGVKVSVCLTDKYPNLGALDQTSRLKDQAVRYHSQPVDSRRVPDELAGFRTLFSAFHHVRPEEERAVLADAVLRRQGIALFEASQRSALSLFVILLVPLMVFLTSPFIRPFRWSRLLWTYALPVVPVVSLFDGLVSCLRTYSVQELRDLTEQLNTLSHLCEIGTLKSTAGPIPITYFDWSPP